MSSAWAGATSSGDPVATKPPSSTAPAANFSLQVLSIYEVCAVGPPRHMGKSPHFHSVRPLAEGIVLL